LDFITAAIYLHYSKVGSTPVGLWAQGCNKTTDPGLAAYKSLTIPSKSKPLVLA